MREACICRISWGGFIPVAAKSSSGIMLLSRQPILRELLNSPGENAR